MTNSRHSRRRLRFATRFADVILCVTLLPGTHVAYDVTALDVVKTLNEIKILRKSVGKTVLRQYKTAVVLYAHAMARRSRVRTDRR